MNELSVSDLGVANTKLYKYIYPYISNELGFYHS